MRNGYDVIWTPKASKELQRLVHYLEVNWTNREVKNFLQKLDNFLEIISLYPESFPLISYNDLHKAVVTEQTSIFYRVRENQIRIISIFDNRKNAK